MSLSLAVVCAFTTRTSLQMVSRQHARSQVGVTPCNQGLSGLSKTVPMPLLFLFFSKRVAKTGFVSFLHEPTTFSKFKNNQSGRLSFHAFLRTIVFERKSNPGFVQDFVKLSCVPKFCSKTTRTFSQKHVSWFLNHVKIEQKVTKTTLKKFKETNKNQKYTQNDIDFGNGIEDLTKHTHRRKFDT